MTLEPWQLIALGTLGTLAGVLNVIAGGGSLLTLPMMIFMGVPEAVANGSNRVAIFAQNVSAVSAFRKQGFSDFKLSLTLALASVPGALLGAHAGALVRGDVFNNILAGVMVSVILLMAQKPTAQSSVGRDPTAAPRSRARLLWGHLAMVGVGFYGGFIQAGVGFLLMAVLHKIIRLDLIRVNMHKVFIVGVLTFAALIVFILHDKVWWLLGLSLACGNALGGWIGSHLTVRKGDSFIRRVLLVTLLAMAVKLILS